MYTSSEYEKFLFSPIKYLNLSHDCSKKIKFYCFVIHLITYTLMHDLKHKRTYLLHRLMRNVMPRDLTSLITDYHCRKMTMSSFSLDSGTDRDK